MSKEFFSPATLPPPVGYSHVAKVNKGTLIYLAGQVSSDASGALVGEGNFEVQVEQVFANVRIAVETAGGSMADIVKMNVYLVAEVDPAEVPKFRAIRDRYVNTQKPPASTLVDEISARPAAAKAMALKDNFKFKTEMDDEARRNMFRHLAVKAA